jgi:hypothetical protein
MAAGISSLNKQYTRGYAEKRGRSRRWLSLSFKILLGISVQTLVLWVVTLYASGSGYHKLRNMLPSYSLRVSSIPLKMKTVCSSRII